MTRTLELDDLYALRNASDPQLSPDGDRVAYVVTQADAEEDRSTSSIWLAPSDGSTPTRALTHGPADRCPQWSPDGTRLAYVSADDGTTALQILPMGGGAPRVQSPLPGAGRRWFTRTSRRRRHALRRRPVPVVRWPDGRDPGRPDQHR